jgi:hypothetical protein
MVILLFYNTSDIAVFRICQLLMPQLSTAIGLHSSVSQVIQIASTFELLHDEFPKLISLAIQFMFYLN